MRILSKTDVGKAREMNQDYCYASEENSNIKLYILADGMGGYKGGEKASKLATESIQKYIYANFEKNKNSREEIVNLIKEAIKFANS